MNKWKILIIVAVIFGWMNFSWASVRQSEKLSDKKSQDFTQGVLVVNTNKSIYVPNENAYIQMAVLGQSGNTICNASLKLTITNPRSKTTILSTEDKTIIRNKTCGHDNVTDAPDYSADYQVLETGKYEMRLENFDTHQHITDSFEVRPSVPFEVERISATRINPLGPKYTMKIKARAQKDYTGKIYDEAPENFQITEQKGITIETKNGIKKIAWNKTIKAGETITLQYEYQAPIISPNLHLLGPLQFADARSGQTVFEEARRWQIASDTDITLFITSGTTWTVPDDWTNTNKIETIGAGGGGRSNATKSGGGGGGAYSYLSNTTSLTAGSTVTVAVSSTGGTAGNDGGDTYLCNSTSNCATIAGTAVIVGSKGGKGGPSGGGAGDGGAGGLASASIGTAVNGGTGGTGTQNGGNGGGGGAGGPGAGTPTAGKTGGNGDTTTANDDGGGGGGGAGGASATNGVNGTTNGGNGGIGPTGTAGGTGGVSANGNNGSNGSGGGGGDDAKNGGNGGSGQEWTTPSTKGAGGGGGGAGNSGTVGGNGGAYGGGGGGGTTGGTGGAGLIVVTYTAAAGCYAKTSGGWDTGTNWTGCTGTGGVPATADDVTISTGITITLNSATPTVNSLKVNGTLDTSGTNYPLNTKTLTVSSTGTLTSNGSTITLTGTGTVFSMNSSGTFTSATSTIKITDTTNTAITFAGAGKTYNNIWFSRGASTASNTITGSNTFADFKDDGSAAHSLLFTNGTTTTVTTFTVSGTAGNKITINSDDTATHTLTKAGGGTIIRDYLNIQHSVATPANTWYAGFNSTNNQAVATAGSGWIFSDGPPGNLTINNSTTTNAGTAPDWVAGASGGNVNITDIQTQINAGTNVSFTGSTITVSNVFSKTSGADVTITMYADENIVVNAAISSTSGKLGMVLNADRGADSSGYINIAGALTSNGGNITLGGGSGVISTGIGFAVGNSGQATGVYINNVAVAAGGGNIIVNGKGYNTTTNGNYGVRVTGASGALTATGAGTINITGTGKGTSNSNTGHGLQVISDGVISTVDGNLTVTGTGGGAGTGSGNYGVSVSGGIKTTGSGNLSVTGTGGNPSGSGGSNYGVYCDVVSCIQTTGTGTLSVTGTGGNGSGSGSNNSGVLVQITPSSITGAGGAMTISGTGGNSSGINNIGILLSDGTISNTSTGTLTITGNGAGTSNSSADYGLLSSGGVISTVDGNLTVTGTGGGAGTGSDNYGVSVLDTNSTIKTTGSGNLSVTGVRGGGDTATNYGVNIAIANGLQTTSAGTITTICDTILMAEANDINSIGNLTIKPYTASATIGVGAGSGTLGLTDTFLTYITWGSSSTLTIGGTGAGDLSINSASTILNKNVTFLTGGDITLVTTALAHAGSSASTLTMQAYGSITTTAAITAATSALTVLLYSDFDVNASGTISIGAGVSSNGGTITVRGGGGSINTTSTFDNLTLDVSGNTITLSTALNISGGLTITAGTLDVTASGCSGSVSCAVTVGGSWSNSGAFTARTGTVTLNTATTATVSGTTTFYKLTITHTAAKEVDFSITASHIIHVTNAFTVTGSSGNLIKLFSTSAANKWHFHPTGTASVDYANVKDGGCESGSITITPTNSTNSGNNESCWSFGGNSAPNSPTSLVQKKVTGGATLATGDWTNETQVQFTASATDTDNPDTLQLCVEKDILGTSFSNTEDSCGSGVAYSGTAVTVTVTITGMTDASEYHWQARVKDTGGLYSSWVSYDVNAESARDFGVDTTAPTGGTMYDGTSAGVDAAFSDNSLSALSANWDGFTSTVSGLNFYEYSMGTTAGGTNIKTWTSNSTTTSVTATGLTLQTSQMYFTNVRANDNAGNVSNVVSSNGQLVLPSITFSLSASTVTFANLNAGNSYTDTQNTTLTTSTNAYNGYVVRLFTTQDLTSTIYPSKTIGGFTGGTYAAPAAYGGGDTGFGVTSADDSVQGSNKFQPSGGVGTLYFPPSHTGAGDIVADHTANVSGSPITSEQFTMTYKVKTTATQSAGPYSTTVIYTITPQY